MTKSITGKMFWTFLAGLLFILFVSWIFISFFLEKYYFNTRLNQLSSSMVQAEEILFSDLSTTEKTVQFDELAANLGGSINVISNDELVFTCGLSIGNRGMGHMGTGHMGKGNGMNMYPSFSNLKKHKDSYYGITTTTNSNITMLIYLKNVTKDLVILFQLPLNPMDQAISVIQDFYLYTIAMAVLLAFILSYVLSKNITRPIKKLNKIANEMRKLNFSVKYTEPRKDEIGQLGLTLNHLTGELKLTLNQLHLELEKERTLDSMRKQFVVRVSHELQTPISVINGYVEALQDGLVDSEEEEKEYLGIISEEVNKTSRLIKDLLDLSQLQSGAYKVKYDVYDLTTDIDKIAAKYKEICKRNQLTLDFKTPEENIFVKADGFRIEQVITNLISNAVKHTPKNGTITIQVLEHPSYVNIQVINTGSHIPDEDLPYIWESFYKVSGDFNIYGTGLGLAISKEILEAHKSSYYAENIEDGVKFSFSLEKSNIKLSPSL